MSTLLVHIYQIACSKKESITQLYFNQRKSLKYDCVRRTKIRIVSLDELVSRESALTHLNDCYFEKVQNNVYW